MAIGPGIIEGSRPSPLVSGSYKEPSRGYCEVLEWNLQLDSVPVARVCARLTAKARLLPRCQVEVWAEAHAAIKNGISPELAYCKSAVHFQTPTARVEWLGRSKGRHVEDSVRGLRCVGAASNAPPAAVRGGVLTLAQAVLGLSAAICGLFGATVLELLAEDGGSGRLVEYYVRMGFEALEAERGNSHAARWMKGALDTVALLGPAPWLAGLVPAEFEAARWLAGFCTLANSPLASLGRFLAAYPSSGVTAGKSSAFPERAGEAVSCLRSVTKGTSQSVTAPSKPRRPQSAMVHNRKVQPHVVAASEAPAAVSSTAPASKRITAKPSTPEAAACSDEELQALLREGTKERRQLEALQQEPIIVLAASSQDPERGLLATWRWRLEWPAGASLIAHLSRAEKKGNSSSATSRRIAKRLRIEARVISADREELVSCVAAVPPERKFARVLWIGRGQASDNLPAHPSIRGQKAYRSQDEVCITAAAALLGTIAKIAAQLGVGTLELYPEDTGSGKLKLYFQNIGFVEAESRGQDTMLRLETPCSSLAQRCCPAAWVEKLSLQASVAAS